MDVWRDFSLTSILTSFPLSSLFHHIHFLLLMKSHLQSYPCPLIINYFWNIGFLLGVAILLQIITGIFLALHYTSDINSAYFSLFFLIREIYYGWCLRYFHSSGVSFVFLFVFLHLGRAMFYASYFYNPNTWFSGIIIYFFLMGIAFMGYVLPLGQMSLWGVTVITNLLSPFPSLVEWLCGGYCIHNPTLKRFFVFHFLLPFVLCAFLLFHIFSLHFLSSNNPLRNSTNNKIAFFPFIISKDLYGKILVLYLYFLQIHFGFSSLSHPDNALEACALLTPLHIVPEWYFLCQYAMLKAVPNKNAGFIILFTSIFILFYFMRSLSMSFYFVVKTSNRFNGFYLCFWFLSFFSFIWIGGQFPVDNFLSYARILTLYYYLLIFWFRGLVVPFVLFSHYILFYSVSGSFWLSYLLVSFSLSHYTPFFPWVYIVCSLLTLHYILFLIFGLLSFINYKKEANHYIYFTFYSVPFWLFPSFQPH